MSLVETTAYLSFRWFCWNLWAIGLISMMTSISCSIKGTNDTSANYSNSHSSWSPSLVGTKFSSKLIFVLNPSSPSIFGCSSSSTSFCGMSLCLGWITSCSWSLSFFISCCSKIWSRFSCLMLPICFFYFDTILNMNLGVPTRPFLLPMLSTFSVWEFRLWTLNAYTMSLLKLPLLARQRSNFELNPTLSRKLLFCSIWSIWSTSRILCC